MNESDRDTTNLPDGDDRSEAVIRAARKAALETGELRRAGVPVCDIAHITGAMREAAAGD